MENFFFFFFLLVTSRISVAQPWQHTYGGSGQHEGYNIIENYDRGFTILGEVGSSPNVKILLIKTDVDGTVLWIKTIGTPGHYSLATGIDNTIDGGLIIGGVTAQYDTMGASFILKLDACGDKQ